MWYEVCWSMKQENECNRGMREKIFINEIGNVRKIESMGYVRNLILEIKRNVNWNNRGSIVEGEILLLSVTKLEIKKCVFTNNIT